MATYNTKAKRETTYNSVIFAKRKFNFFSNVLIGKSEFDSEYKRRHNPLILDYLHCKKKNKHTNDGSYENQFVLGKGE